MGLDSEAVGPARATGAEHRTIRVGELSVTIRHDEDPSGSRGRFSAWVDGRQTAELDYLLSAGPVWDLVHTYAAPAMRGTGVADALVGTAMDDARRAGARIVPSCPYIPVWLSRHPEYRDLVGSRP